mmetsp:Transcript_11664/g.33233  ORF Transcript_11664/g.33233 Transcript_11664/m.33233 type:complete len:337 (+) Transcript_11664:71-1081(+)|eukprot:CAMPEP_0176237178 /NCGR_PEP_ID=MMETSP0121_2-20121125/27718_1 /TAXON_ID=160619 /ORGANISM="Kryptoperidinium foliaceum, Strain CCMP 1326" /LENGTH=336 /DNA_ID=CAMNT_0017576619 /DNA_START=78 /DNA_END=1088 /DNA_ORIENTATION=+
MACLSFDKSGEGKKARAVFLTRSCLSGLALIAVAASAVLVAQRASEGLWDAGRWHVVGGDTLLRAVCVRRPHGIGACSLDWEDFKDAHHLRWCYKLTDAPLRWDDAVATCRAETGDAASTKFLASIPDRAANALVREICGAHGPCWIGALWSAEGWRWSDSETAWAWENWADGEQGSSEAHVAISGSEALTDAAAVGLLVANVVVASLLCGLCWGFKGGFQSRNGGCLACAVGCDCLCILVGVLGLAAGVVHLVRSFEPILVVDVVLRVCLLGGLVAAGVMTLQLRSSMAKSGIIGERDAEGAMACNVVGVPVVDEPTEGVAVGSPRPEESPDQCK